MNTQWKTADCAVASPEDFARGLPEAAELDELPERLALGTVEAYTTPFGQMRGTRGSPADVPVEYVVDHLVSFILEGMLAGSRFLRVRRPADNGDKWLLSLCSSLSEEYPGAGPPLPDWMWVPPAECGAALAAALFRMAMDPTVPGIVIPGIPVQFSVQVLFAYGDAPVDGVSLSISSGAV